MKKVAIIIISLSQIFIGCEQKHKSLTFQFSEIEVPTFNSGQSRVFESPTGTYYLSWVEYKEDDSFVFQYSKLENEKWSEPIEIARGSDWFVNWADFPSLIATNDDRLVAHWLQMRGGGTYEYDIHIAQSSDGSNWNQDFIPHRDSLAAEHGFVTMQPGHSDQVVAVWLDGRNSVVSDEDKAVEGHGHGKGAMTLRTATFDKDGRLFDEEELDHRICDCCQTDMAMTDEGPVIVYRDRSESEIRDISVVRKYKGNWTDPVPVHSDQWEINACPVNGPSIAVSDNNVAVIWYTAAYGEPKVKLALSEDYGANFKAPIQIDEGNPIGRVDIATVQDDSFFVTWMEEHEEGAMIKARIVSIDGEVSESYDIMETSASRRSGFPVISEYREGALITWTEVVDGSSRVRSGVIK